jgi:hypothetical protein
VSALESVTCCPLRRPRNWLACTSTRIANWPVNAWAPMGKPPVASVSNVHRPGVAAAGAGAVVAFVALCLGALNCAGCVHAAAIDTSTPGPMSNACKCSVDLPTSGAYASCLPPDPRRALPRVRHASPCCAGDAPAPTIVFSPRVELAEGDQGR